MHTQTSAVPAPERRGVHRHFFALPLFLLLLGSALFTGHRSSAARADIVAASNAAIVTTRKETLRFPSSAGILSEDSRLRQSGDDLYLDDGVLLLSSEGMASVHAGDLTASGLRGGFMVIRNADAVSLLALTTPVLVSRGGYRFVIPEGRRGDWSIQSIPEHADLHDVAERIATIRPMPEELLRDTLLALRSLAPPPLPAFTGASTDPIPDFLILPAARERERVERKKRLLQELRVAFRENDIVAARRALENPLTQEALSSDEDGEAILRTLVIESRTMPSVGGRLIGSLDDADFLLLLSFHRDFRFLAWSAAVSPSLPMSARTLRLLQLPSSDLGDAVPAAAVRAWEGQLQLHLDASDQPGAFLELLLTSLRGYREYAEREGLPERLQRYAQALRRLVGDHAAALSPDARELFAAWSRVGVTPDYSEPPAPPPAVEPALDSPSAPSTGPAGSPSLPSAAGGPPQPMPESFDAFALQEGLRRLLQDAGALFMTTTTVTAQSANAVDVQSLVFVSGASEHVYAFTFHPATRTLSNVKRDGEPSLYALSFDAFVRWARGE